MKYILIAILMNATNGDEIQRIPQDLFGDYEMCQQAAEAQGVVHIHGRIALVYDCRRVERSQEVKHES